MRVGVRCDRCQQPMQGLEEVAAADRAAIEIVGEVVAVLALNRFASPAADTRSKASVREQGRYTDAAAVLVCVDGFLDEVRARLHIVRQDDIVVVLVLFAISEDVVVRLPESRLSAVLGGLDEFDARTTEDGKARCAIIEDGNVRDDALVLLVLQRCDEVDEFVLSVVARDGYQYSRLFHVLFVFDDCGVIRHFRGGDLDLVRLLVGIEGLNLIPPALILDHAPTVDALVVT